MNTTSGDFNPIETKRREVLSVYFWTARTHFPTCVALEQRTGEGAAYGTFFGPGKVLWKQQKKNMFVR